MNWRRLAFWFGVVALADAVLLVAPVDLPAELFGGVVPRVVVPLLAVVAAGYGAVVLAGAAAGAPDREPAAARDSDDGAVDRVGADVDAAFAALSGESDRSRRGAARLLRSELRRSVLTALEARGHPPEEAERLVETGAWTDDRRAAAFLGGATLSLSTRIRDWATGEPTRRRAEAAAAALAALTDPDRAAGGPRSGPGGGPGPGRDARRPATAVLGGPQRGDRDRREGTADRESEVEA